MEQRIQKLNKQVSELMEWMSNDKRQPIVFPMNTETRSSVQKNQFVITSNELTPVVNTSAYAEINWDGKILWVPVVTEYLLA